MGAQSSRTRRITIDNDEPVNANLIKVSDEVVDRLRGSDEVRKRNAATLPTQVPVYLDTPAPVPLQQPQPPPYYHYQPSLSSLQIRQETANTIKLNDEYWEKRLNDLEKCHEKMKNLMEEEYKKAMEESAVKQNDLAARCEIPCLSKRKNVLKCYKKYPNEPMRCAKEVQAFTECVDLNRVKVVESVRG